MAGVVPILQKFQFTSSTGAPLANGAVTVYLAGTTTLTNTWQDLALTVLNTNPIQLDSRGECVIYLDPTLTYKFVLANAGGVVQWTADNVGGSLNAATLSASTGAALIGFAPSGLGAATTTVQAKLREIVSVKDFGAVGDGSTNDSTAIQEAIDDRAARGGGVVYFPAGNYRCNVVLKQGVVLSSLAGGQFGYLASGNIGAVTLTQAAAGFVVDTPASSIVCCGVEGINFKGLGSATAGGGVRFQNVTWGSVKGCQFDNFADQAILKSAGIANTFEDILTTNVLLNRVRAAVSGCIELAGGADDFLHRIEANPSLLAGKSDANLRVCGIVVVAANVFAESCIGEFSDIGIYTTGAHCRLVNCRADLNWGHGFYCDGVSQYANCKALNNSQDATNTYSGFYVDGQGDTFSGCVAYSSAAAVHKYGFEDLGAFASVTSRNVYVGCQSVGHGTAAFLMQPFLGSSPIEPGTPTQTTSATPDSTGTTYIACGHAAPTLVTNILGGYSGKTVRLRGNPNVTIQNGVSFRTNTGANKTLAADRIYSFTLDNGIWFEAE